MTTSTTLAARLAIAVLATVVLTFVLALIALLRSAPALHASAPNGTGCLKVHETVAHKNVINTKYCFPNGPILN